MGNAHATNWISESRLCSADCADVWRNHRSDRGAVRDMAQKFGGKFSPDGASDTSTPTERSAFQGAKVDPVGARANILFLPAIPMVFLALNDGAVNLVVALVAAGILTLAAWVLRGGLQAEAAYHARKVARRPAIPRKLFASALTGIGVALAAYRSEPGLVAPSYLASPQAGCIWQPLGLIR